ELQQSNLFAALRLLLVGAILMVMAGELVLYFVVRQTIKFYKQRVVWYGKTGRLQRSLRNAQSYKEYIEIAKKLDRHLEKYWADDKYYDAKLLQRITQMLSKARVQAEKAAAEQGSSKKAQATAIALADVLRQGALRANTGGWENIHAWAQTYAEPAKVVDEYVAEVVASINRLQKSQHLTTAEKRNVLRQIARQQGRAALCLSGGAAMGWKHLGVLRGLLDAGCLPQAVSGASAGALMAALVGTHLDVELRCILRPEMAKYVTMCQGDFWAQAQRWMRLGHWFDAIEWAPRTQMFTRGSLTFEEAYARTGRVLCITATPQNVRHAQGQLLNYMTTPNVVIWSAVIASASLPGAIQPVVLLAKNRDGQIVPYTDSGIEWRDGSFCSDVPRSLLKTLLNVQFTVVSQVNPHVTLFFYARNGAVGLPVCNWRGRGIAVAMEHILKLDICKWLRLLSDLNLTPPRQQDWARVWLQKFEGSITILPHAHLGEYLRLLRDPTPASLARSMHVGKSATWPALRLIQARLAIENAI
ncbi:patatin-domain-containing protein, partial [Coemansia reversa NRRL 1564]